MAKLALIGQAQYGNTKKIAHELAKGGWNVEIFDASKPSQFKHGRMPAGFDLLLLIAGHIPGGLNQRFKDTCRAAKQRFLETSPDWSSTSVLLSKYGLLPAPSIIPNLAPTISTAPPPPEIFSTPTGVLTHKPLADLDKKIEEQKKAEKVEVVKVALVPTMPKKPEEVKVNGKDEHKEKYPNWKTAVTADGSTSKLVNPYIASRIEESAAAGQVALEMLKNGGLASIPIGDGYEKYVEVQKAAGKHFVGDNIWRRLRRRTRLEMGLPDDSAWWAGKIHGQFTPNDRRRMAKELIKEHPEWSGGRIIDEVREMCGVGVDDAWIRKEMDKARKAARRDEAKEEAVKPAPEPSQAAVDAVKLLEAKTKLEEAKKAAAALPVKLEAQPSAAAKAVSKEDELKAAIDLLKGVLKGSGIETVLFTRQPDGEYKAKTTKPRVEVDETEY